MRDAVTLKCRKASFAQWLMCISPKQERELLNCPTRQRRFPPAETQSVLRHCNGLPAVCTTVVLMDSVIGFRRTPALRLGTPA